MSPREGLVVIVPGGFDESRIPRILDRKREWIRKSEERVAEQRKFLQPDRSSELPERVVFRAIGADWWIDYRVTGAETVTAVERGRERLLVYGNLESVGSVHRALRRWVARKAHEHIEPWVRALAEDRGLSVNRVIVKAQRTRWASCSSKGTISVNLRLMFLPESLVRYVVLHELAHTMVLNHSRQFWSAVETLEPDYRRLNEQLRTAWRFVPSWLSPYRSGEQVPSGAEPVRLSL